MKPNRIIISWREYNESEREDAEAYALEYDLVLLTRLRDGETVYAVTHRIMARALWTSFGWRIIHSEGYKQ